MEAKKPVGIWIRVSTEDQKNGESPEHHEMRGKMYAQMKDWNVTEVYHLEGISGKTVMDHPETRRMLHDIYTKRITGLIFSKLARFARNTRELLEFSEIFQKHNADLISLQESIDTSSPAGRLFYTLQAAMAQWEREEIASRVAASVPIRAKLGKPLGGAAPYGYKWEDKKLEIDSKEAPIRKYMFELFLKHKRKRVVARTLNEEGYRTRKGAKFSDTTITRLLTDPLAKGLRRANYSKSLGKGKKWVKKPESDWVMIEAPAIVSIELWEKVNAILKAQEQSKKKRAKPGKYLFTGFVFCHCSEKMYVKKELRKYRCNKCKNKIGIKDLENIFHVKRSESLISKNQIDAHFSQAEKTISDKELRLRNLRNEVITIQKELNNLIKLQSKGELPADGFRHHYQPVFDQYQQIENQIPILQGEIDYIKVQQLSTGQAYQDAQVKQSQWEQLTFEEKRLIVETVIIRIEIGLEDIEFTLFRPQTPPVPPKLTANSQYNHRDSSKQST